MDIVQDTICGIRMFTLCDPFLDWNAVQNILLWIPKGNAEILTPVIIRPKPLCTASRRRR